MPVFNPLVSSRYAEQLRRYLGEDVTLGSVAPEIMPVIVIEGDDPELALIKQETLFGGFTSIAAGGAATFATTLVLNPSTSGLLVTLVAVEALNPYQLGIQRAVATAGFSLVASQPFALDSRSKNATNVLPQLFTRNDATVLTQYFARIHGSNLLTLVPGAVVLAPGDGAWITTTTSNTANEISVFGKHRPFKVEELVQV